MTLINDAIDKPFFSAVLCDDRGWLHVFPTVFGCKVTQILRFRAVGTGARV